MGLAEVLGATLERGIDRGVTPGAAVAAVEGDELVAVVCRGATADAGDGGAAVTAETVYDLASLTKPLATWALAVRALASGSLDLASPAHRFLEGIDRRVELSHLLGHAAGFPAHRELYHRIRAGDLGGAADPRAALVAMAAATELEAAPGSRALYSDLGYIVLGAILERAGAARLDELFAAEIAAPLGLGTIAFRPVGAAPPASPAELAPSERDPERGGLVVGEVHDENAHAAGGVCGHAGLFGAASDVARFAAAVGRAARGERGGPFDPAVVAELLSRSAAPDTTWLLGWDRPSPLPARSHAGDLWPRHGFGHLGFTGTSLWIDAPRGRAVALLTNRVYRSRDAAPIREMRREVMDAVSASSP